MSWRDRLLPRAGTDRNDDRAAASVETGPAGGKPGDAGQAAPVGAGARDPRQPAPAGARAREARGPRPLASLVARLLGRDSGPTDLEEPWLTPADPDTVRALREELAAELERVARNHAG
jgi:hypothetical protein